MPSENTDYSSNTYQSHASFVPLLTSRLTTLISPSPSDRILDLGAGDLVYSSRISQSCSHLLAVDASSQLLTSGIEAHPSSTYPNLHTQLVDCRYLNKESDIVNGTWDKVVSNAALHWILRDEETRENVIRAVYDCLKPNAGNGNNSSSNDENNDNSSSFIAEMGGMGNIADVHSAIVAILYKYGCSLESIRKQSPWYFPSQEEMTGLLEKVGFKVQVMEMEYRPTLLSEGKEGGVGAWVKMFGSRYLELLKDEKEREEAVVEIVEVLKSVCLREDGRWVVGYNRLRFKAVKE